MRHFLLTITLLSVYVVSFAQDANYWSNSYNAGNFFTPGAVIASNKDSGGFFYNPALLAYETKNSTSINGNLYQYQRDIIKKGAGSGLDLRSSDANIIPLLVSGTIALKTKKPFAISYALIRNPVINFQATQRKDTRMNVLDDSYSPGAETYVGQIALQNKASQTSGFVNIGFKLSSKWAFGFSMEGQIYQQNLMESYSSTALINMPDNSLFPPMASAIYDYQASLYHLGLKFKAGLAYNSGRHHLGLLISTPIISLGGSATLYNDSRIDNIIFGESPGYDTLNLLANTRQTGLKPRIKAPFSFAVGYAYDYNESGQIYFSGEYFTKVGEYNVITPNDDYFFKLDSADGIQETSKAINLVNSNKAVFNFGVGISYKLAEDITGYTSFTSDFSFIDKFHNGQGVQIRSTSSNWNIWHLQLGANFKRRKFNLRPGLLLSYGRTGNYLQPINFDDPDESNLLLGDSHLTPASHFSVGLMLSYIYNF